MKSLYSDPLGWVSLACAKKSTDTVLTCLCRRADGVVATDRHRMHFAASGAGVALPEGLYEPGTLAVASGYGMEFPNIVKDAAEPASWWFKTDALPLVQALVEGAVACAKTLKRPGHVMTLAWVNDVAFDASYVRDALRGMPEDVSVYVSLQGSKRALRLESADGDRVAVISKVDAVSEDCLPFNLTGFLGTIAEATT